MGIEIAVTYAYENCNSRFYIRDIATTIKRETILELALTAINFSKG